MVANTAYRDLASNNTMIPRKVTNNITYRVMSISHKFLRLYSVTPSACRKPTGHVMHQQFNIQQLYVLPTLYLCVLYLSEDKQRLVPLTP